MAHKYIELDVDALRELTSNTDFLVDSGIVIEKKDFGYGKCSSCEREDQKIVYIYGEKHPLCATCAKEILN